VPEAAGGVTTGNHPAAAAASTIAAGVMGAASLGEIAPVSADVRMAFGLSPLALGATISLITLITAAIAAPAGLWLRDRDPGPWLAGGLAVMAAGGALMTVAAPSQIALIGLRAAQGGGYLVIVVGGPVALLRRLGRDRSQTALALWGGCTPAGLAISAATGGLAAGHWRLWFAALAAASALLAAIVVATSPRPARAIPPERTAPPLPGRAIPRGPAIPRAPAPPLPTPAPAPPPAAPPAPRPPVRLGGPLLLAAGFGLLSLLTVAVVSVYPAYLSGPAGLTAAAAGGATSAVAAASLPANAAAALLLRRGVPPGLLTSAMLACPLLAFAGFASSAPVAVRIGAASLLVFAVGLAASAAYASLPAVAGRAGAVPLVNGIMVQAGCIGALVGPPLFTAVTGLRHWYLIGYLAIPAAVVSAAAMTAAATGRRWRPAGLPRSAAGRPGVTGAEGER
jgi:MFS family permease